MKNIRCAVAACRWPKRKEEIKKYRTSGKNYRKVCRIRPQKCIIADKYVKSAKNISLWLVVYELKANVTVYTQITVLVSSLSPYSLLLYYTKIIITTIITIIGYFARLWPNLDLLLAISPLLCARHACAELEIETRRISRGDCQDQFHWRREPGQSTFCLGTSLCLYTYGMQFNHVVYNIYIGSLLT